MNKPLFESLLLGALLAFFCLFLAGCNKQELVFPTINSDVSQHLQREGGIATEDDVYAYYQQYAPTCLGVAGNFPLSHYAIMGDGSGNPLEISYNQDGYTNTGKYLLIVRVYNNGSASECFFLFPYEIGDYSANTSTQMLSFPLPNEDLDPNKDYIFYAIPWNC